MTSNYNAGRETIKEYIFPNRGLNDIKNPNIDLFINDFHDFLTSSLFKYIFIRPREDVINTQGFNLKLSDSDLSLAYFFMKSERKEIRNTEMSKS